MNKLRHLIFSLFFFLDPDALAVTDTWDGNGGTGANNNFSNNLNWLDDTAPSSDLVNTDLIFATANKLTPNVIVALSAHSIIFDNTSGAFSIGGLALSIGTGGIRNDDADTQTFTNTIDFSGVVSATINAASGRLTFTNTVTLPTVALTVAGGNPTSFADISGATGLTKNGAGMMTWAPTVNTSFDITVNNGSITTVADGSMDVFTNFSEVVINNPAVFNAQEDIRLSGAHFSLTGPLTQLNVASGKILTIESGGKLDLTDGAADLSVSNMVVTGSTSSVTAINILFGNSGTFAISAGADVTVTGNLFIGTFGDGSLTLNGSGSTLSGAITKIARSGNDGTLTFTAGSSGTLGALELGDGGSGNSNAILNIQSASVVHATGLVVAGDAGNATCTGVVTVTGSGSLLTLDGAATATIGSATGSVGTLNVQNSGTFESGTGLTTVNATGTVAITDGVYTSHGDFTLNGGQLTRDGSGVFGIDAGKSFTIQAGGDAIFTNVFGTATASSIVVTGSGSTLSTTSALLIRNGSSFTVQNGADVTSGSSVNLGNGGDGTLTVDGAGSTFTTSIGGTVISMGGFTGSALFDHGSQGNLGAVIMSNSATASSNSLLTVQNGSSVSVSSVSVGAAAASNTAGIIVTGPGSTLNLSGAATIGAATSSSASVGVGNGGILSTGNALFTINATGTVQILSGGTLTGPSDFAGTGTLNLAGNYLPGDASGPQQTTSVTFAQDMFFASTTNITLEIGGVNAGSQHDQLIFNGPGNPHLARAGTLNLVLINGFVPQVENAFNLFDFDPARDVGAFAITAPSLGAGKFWRFDQLYNSGVVRISVTSDIYFQWQSAYGSGAVSADDDHDGVPNGIEFLLGTNPEVSDGPPLIESTPVVGASVTTGVTFKIPSDPGADAHYRVQASPDLVGWTTIASKDGGGAWSGSASVITGPITAGLTSITVNETLPLGTTKRFHRLQAP